MILMWFFHLLQSVALDQGLDADLMSEIEDQMQPLLNDGLRQRIITLVKVGPDETWIYLMHAFYSLIQLIELDIFKEIDHGEVKCMSCKLSPLSNNNSELILWPQL